MKFVGGGVDREGGGEGLSFPHHENESTKSETFPGKTFARFWMHVRFLLVEGKKMSKSEGNFFTLRDLLLKGHKPSAIRYLLASVPYTRQLNFTFAGLEQAAHSVQRLRDFKSRLAMANLPPGKNQGVHDLAEKTQIQMRSALDDDLNTAQALAAIFDMDRETNTLADHGDLRHDDTAPLLNTLPKIDYIL